MKKGSILINVGRAGLVDQNSVLKLSNLDIWGVQV